MWYICIPIYDLVEQLLKLLYSMAAVVGIVSIYNGLRIEDHSRNQLNKTKLALYNHNNVVHSSTD